MIYHPYSGPGAGASAMPQPQAPYYNYASADAAGAPYPTGLIYPSANAMPQPDAAASSAQAQPFAAAQKHDMPARAYPGHSPSFFGLPPASNVSANSPGMGAVFKKRVERIDWRKIAALDVDRITRDMDIQSLQDNLMNITFCNLESEVDCRAMDPNFTKLFKLAQLSIEYLLYSQEYLANVMAGMETRLNHIVMDHESTKSQLEKQRLELVQVKKESHKRKKLLAAQQQILHSGAQAYHKCPFCPKAFVHESYCVSHIQRRHADQAASGVVQSAPVSPQRYDHVTAPVQSHDELADVKERLRATERLLMESERQRNEVRSISVEEQQKMMESWKIKERERHREEFESMRQMFLSQFEELRSKYVESERQLMKQRGNNTGGAVSNLGDLADDTDTETDRARTINNNNIRNLLMSPERSLRNQMDDHTYSIEQRNQQEIARLDAVLKQSHPAISPPGSQPNTPKHKPADENAVIAISLPAGGGVSEDDDHQGEMMFTHEVAAPAAAAAGILPPAAEPPITSLHNELIKTAPASSSAQKRSHSPVVSPRSVSPSKKQKDRLSPGERPVYDRTDDEMIDDEDESELQEVNQEFTMWRNEEALKGTLSQSTLGSTGPADDLGTDESLIGTSIRSQRLNKQLGKDPDLLKGLLAELEQVLYEQLEERGIPRDLTGISNTVLNSKLDAMEKERQVMEKKYVNFYKIRRQYERKVNREAELKWREMKEKEKYSPKKTVKASPNKKSSSMPNLAPSSSAARSTSPQRSPIPGRRSPGKKPANLPRSPRSPVIIRKETSGSSPALEAPPRTSVTLSTEYSSAPETHDDDYTESSEGETENDTEGIDEPDSPVKVNQPGSPAVKVIMSGPPPAAPRTPESEKAPPMTPKTPRDEISDWDSTEMSDIRPTVRSANVGELAKSVDNQLKGRSTAQRPFGGVNTVPSAATSGQKPKQPSIEDDDDDLSISVSSLQDNLPAKPAPAPAPRKHPVHTSADMSSNTGGTSVWGSVSKAAGTPLVGVGKSSQSLTDFDSDLDLDELDMVN